MGKLLIISKFQAAVLLLCLTIMSGCLPTPPHDKKGGITIVVYGFSIMKEPLENEIYPAFSEKWKHEHGIGVNFVSSYAGSETITNQILQGAPADVAILSIERDADRLLAGGATTGEWPQYPNKGIINKTPFVILVRKGNPKGIMSFADLSRPGIRVIHPDPVSSGGAQWSILSIYGSELRRTEAETGQKDPIAAAAMLKEIWKNVIATPGSAREARTQFETGYGDALITYELEGLMMQRAGTPVEIIVPKSTIFSEHPVVLIDRNVNTSKHGVVQAFINFLWSDEAQRSFVKYFFRSAANPEIDSEQPGFAPINDAFSIDYFGGWKRAYPEIIEGVFRDQVQR